MRSLVDEKIDLTGVGLKRDIAHAPVFLKHPVHFLAGEFQRLHIGDRAGDDRALDLESGFVKSGKYGACGMEKQDLSPAFFMFSVSDGDTGNDVVDLVDQFPRLPQIFVFVKGPFPVGL